MTEEIESYPEGKRKIGGSLQDITLTLNSDPAFDWKPVQIQVTSYPSNELQKAGLNNLYSLIQVLVPQEINDDIKAKTTK
jgi:hypothetical protein